MRWAIRRSEPAVSALLAEPISAAAFKDEVRFLAQRLDVEPGEVHLVGMRRKWASCSPKGRVTFDTQLLRQAEPFRREVILHELLHLKVPNHGRLFSALLRTYLADAAHDLQSGGPGGALETEQPAPDGFQ